jgi:hypothetical protein
MQGVGAVQRGHDFIFNKIKYQVKGNRPSGRQGCNVTLVSKAKNYDWDFLIWVLYDREYQIQEAWRWEQTEYKKAFEGQKYTRPPDIRGGKGVQIF